MMVLKYNQQVGGYETGREVSGELENFLLSHLQEDMAVWVGFLREEENAPEIGTFPKLLAACPEHLRADLGAVLNEGDMFLVVD